MKNDKRTSLEVQRDRLLEQLALCKTNCAEYESLSKELGTIYDLIEKEKKTKAMNRISPDTKALIAANLLGIGVLGGLEHILVLPHKAFQWVKRLF